MARPEHQRSRSLDEALAALRRDPDQPVLANLDNMDIELRVVRPAAIHSMKPGDWMAAGGPWQGERPDEILRRLREARESASISEPPKL
jgi:hypothetical protein